MTCHPFAYRYHRSSSTEREDFSCSARKHAKHLIFIEYFIIKKHNRSCQDIFLHNHCKQKRRSWKLVVSDCCLHSKGCKSRQSTTSTTLVIPGPTRSNLVVVVGSKGPYWRNVDPTRPNLRIYALLAIYPIFPRSLRALLQTRFSCTWLRIICIQCCSLQRLGESSQWHSD